MELKNLYNTDLERSILSAFLWDNDEAINNAVNDAIFTGKNVSLYQGIRKLLNGGISADLISVSQECAQFGISGSYISEVMDHPQTTNVEYAVKKLQELALKRSAVMAYQDGVKSLCAVGTDALEIIQKTSNSIEFPESKEAVYIDDAIGGFYDRFLASAKAGESTAIMTGMSKFDAVVGGFDKAEVIIVGGRPGHGKELSNDSDILMWDGSFKKMGDMVTGDLVASVDGEKSVVNGVFPQGLKPVYKITFSDGRSVEAGLEHQWQVMNRNWRLPRVMTTKDLIEKLKFKRYKKRLYIPQHSGGFGEDRNIKIHPYLLGVLIGDGGFSSRSIALTTSYNHIINRINPMLLGTELRLNEKITYRLSVDRGKPNPILDEIKKLGLYGKKSVDKFIPKQYLNASKQSRLELMRGLIDTDGTVEKSGTMTYSTSSPRLAKDFQKLARSLGSYAVITTKNPTYTYKGEKKNGQKSYTIFISCSNYGEFVTIPHKKDRIVKKYANKNLNIESIEYVGHKECQCISVSHPSKLYMTNDYIVTHNTSQAMCWARRWGDFGIPGMIFSLEMSKDQLSGRMACDVGSIDGKYIMRNELEYGNPDHDEIWADFRSAVRQIASMPIIIDDTPSRTIQDIRSAARKAKRKDDIQWVMIDYVQLIRGWDRDGQGPKSEIMAEIKAMSKELDLPVVVVSQMNRKIEERNIKIPNNADLRDAGSIEQVADHIVFCIIPSKFPNAPEEDLKDKGKAYIFVTKTRRGEVGLVKGIRWDGRYFRYYQENNFDNF